MKRRESLATPFLVLAILVTGAFVTGCREDDSSGSAPIEALSNDPPLEQESSQHPICPGAGLPPAEIHEEWIHGCVPKPDPPDSGMGGPGFSGEDSLCEPRLSLEWVNDSPDGSDIASSSGDFTIRVRNNRDHTIPVVLFARIQGVSSGQQPYCSGYNRFGAVCVAPYGEATFTGNVWDQGFQIDGETDEFAGRLKIRAIIHSEETDWQANYDNRSEAEVKIWEEPGFVMNTNERDPRCPPYVPGDPYMCDGVSLGGSNGCKGI